VGQATLGSFGGCWMGRLCEMGRGTFSSEVETADLL
jgi:hypothetical protein